MSSVWPFLIPRFQCHSQISNSDISLHLHLRDHQFPVGCLAWSLDDTILLSSCETLIKMWNTEVRLVPCSRKSRPLNSSVVWCPHSDDRGPYRTGLSTCLATRWIWIHFSLPSQDRKINLWLRPCLLATCCLINFRLRTAVQGSNIANAEE